MEYSVVIPVFNEEKSLHILQERLNKIMQALNEDYEIIYVDDKSTDNSLEVLKNLKEKYPKIKILSLKMHVGQSSALFAGFKLAKGNWIITLDADLQNAPEDLKLFLPFKKDFDFITGIRKKRKDNLLRIISSKIAYFFRYLILQDKTKDIGCALRIFKREIVDYFPFFKNFHRFFTYLVKETGYKVKEVEVSHYPRKFGKTKYGIMNRLFQGIVDLWGVFWLKKRLLKYKDE